MFTGIILAVGKITDIQKRRGDCRLTIDTGKLPLEGVALGDSIAVNGVCLTAIEMGKQFFCADVSNESLSKTTLNFAQIGTAVNLELALTLSTRLGGHLVSGHIDGMATIIEKKADGRSMGFKFKVPSNLAKYIAEKGSICLDGISLTVNSVAGVFFEVNIVPHTLKETTFYDKSIGSKVNIEVDLLARYMERLMQGSAATDSDHQLTMTLLHQSGFTT